MDSTQYDKTSTVYITEGPFDSNVHLQFDCYVRSDADISSWGISDPVWIYDNEPRNREIVSRIQRTINNGDKG